MTVSNAAIGDTLRRLADLLEIEGANTFRVRAYRDAAQTVTDLPQSVASMLAAGEDLTELPGIGEDLAEKLKEIVETGGRLALLEEVERRTPQGLAELLTVPGLGPKRVRALHDALGITGRAELASAVEAGRVRGLPGFGAKTEDTIRRALERGGVGERRFKLADIEPVAEALAGHLRSASGVGEVVVAGSYRRRRETVGDLDVVATCTAPGSDVMARFVTFDEVEEVLGHGPTRGTVRLRSGLQVDLRVVPGESFGAALHYFTGSRAHSVALRGVAQDRGLKINEYGIFRGEERIAGRTEAEFYGALGLPYFEPELRENRGEFEAAREGRLPKLVTLADVRGNLHAHTTWSDGRSSLEDMAAAAKVLGYEYLAITDHSRRVTVAHGLDAKRLAQQIEAVDRLNGELDGLVLLKSCEVDILEDGSLDLPDEVLKRLDLRVCSIHSKFNLSRDRQTERIIRAMDNPYFNIFAHPTGRMVNGRPGYEVDLERVMTAALERGCYLEVNGQPDRLDLSDVNCQMTKAMGLKVAVSSDAHSAAGLGLMRFGVDQARRGWLEPDDVLNTRSWPELRRLLLRRA